MPEFSDPVTQPSVCEADNPVAPTTCSQDTPTAVTTTCSVGPGMDPLETTAIPCGTQLLGCTNRAALNYNPRATENDGSCVFLQPPTISYPNISVPVGESFSLSPTIGGDAYQSISISSTTPIPSWVRFIRGI